MNFLVIFKQCFFFSEAKGGNSFIYVVYFYSKFLQELEDCHDAPAKVGQCFTNRVSVSCQGFFIELSFLKRC